MWPRVLPYTNQDLFRKKSQISRPILKNTKPRLGMSVLNGLHLTYRIHMVIIPSILAFFLIKNVSFLYMWSAAASRAEKVIEVLDNVNAKICTVT